MLASVQNEDNILESGCELTPLFSLHLMQPIALSHHVYGHS
jgi:hypothetical protein